MSDGAGGQQEARGVAGQTIVDCCTGFWLMPSVSPLSFALFVCLSPAAISYIGAVARFTNFLHIRSVMCVSVCVCAAAVITEEETTGIGSHTTLRIIVMTAYLALPTKPKHTKSNDKFYPAVCVCVFVCMCVCVPCRHILFVSVCCL